MKFILLETEEVQKQLLNVKDSGVIINGMLLCNKGINWTASEVQLCNKCHNHNTHE
jgi:hypothetical protein